MNRLPSNVVNPLLWFVIAVAAMALVVVLVVRRRALSRLSTPPAVARPVRLSDRLTRSRRALGEALGGLLGSGRLDTPFWEGVEEALLASDLGIKTAASVVEAVRHSQPKDAAGVASGLRTELLSMLDGKDRAMARRRAPSVVLVVGVNGVGKTTTIAKLAHHLRRQGLSSLLGAADTFRAGADAQLRVWADRVGVDVVGGQEGADPASVAFDAVAAARARHKDVVIVDTAGRLHSKHNLMAELGKVVKVLEREGGGIDEVLLVLDATTGQNGLAQVKVFTETVGVTGIVLTKLDGTARGGIVMGVEEEIGVPVKFVGVGEGVDDLVPFQPQEFVDALLADI